MISSISIYTPKIITRKLIKAELLKDGESYFLTLSHQPQMRNMNEWGLKRAGVFPLCCGSRSINCGSNSHSRVGLSVREHRQWLQTNAASRLFLPAPKGRRCCLWSLQLELLMLITKTHREERISVFFLVRRRHRECICCAATDWWCDLHWFWDARLRAQRAARLSHQRRSHAN